MSTGPETAAAARVCDPAWTPLFAPRRPVWGRYEVCATPQPADAPDDRDAFVYTAVEHLEALDAFGTAGAYDRARLAQLYRGTRVTVLRGWRRTPGWFEAVTRISPYPDPSLSRLYPGTLIIRWIADD